MPLQLKPPVMSFIIMQWSESKIPQWHKKRYATSDLMETEQIVAVISQRKKKTYITGLHRLKRLLPVPYFLDAASDVTSSISHTLKATACAVWNRDIIILSFFFWSQRS